MDNDFLKHLDSLQVREIVDCMYSREFKAGSYVIREGEAGAHLFVSAEGEFEVMQGDKVLGQMGPRKAFGELAILYNCTRTASIKGNLQKYTTFIVACMINILLQLLSILRFGFLIEKCSSKLWFGQVYKDYKII